MKQILADARYLLPRAALLVALVFALMAGLGLLSGSPSAQHPWYNADCPRGQVVIAGKCVPRPTPYGTP